MMRGRIFAGVLCATCALAARQVVTYEQFGAVGDGKTDDMDAIVAAHAAANGSGLPVKAGEGKVYYIGGADKKAVIRTDVDFGTARFVIDDRAVKNRSRAVFDVPGETKALPVKGVSALTRGQRTLGVALAADSMVVAENAAVKQFIRFGPNRNNGVAQQEAFLVSRDGTISAKTPLTQDFAALTRLTAKPVETRTLTLSGGRFQTIANRETSKYTYYNRGISISRSRVCVKGMRYDVTGEGETGAPYKGFLSIQDCAHVTVTGCVFTAHRTYYTIGNAGTRVGMGSYALSVNRAIDVSFIDCSQTTDILDRRYWGLFGSNFCRDLLFERCAFSRFDAHMGVANAVIRGSKLGHQGINAIGCGTFLIEDSTVYGHAFVTLRPDYGSFWNGDFIIRNCVFVPGCGGRTVGRVFGGDNKGQHDFGYPCAMPARVLVDGMKIMDGNHPASYGGPFLFAAFNDQKKDASYHEPYPYRVTQEVTLRNVTTASGKPLRISPNAYLFKDTKIIRR